MVVAIAPNGEPIYECFKCRERGTGDNLKRVQFQDRQEPRPISRHESLADDLCDNGDG